MRRRAVACLNSKRPGMIDDDQAAAIVVRQRVQARCGWLRHAGSPGPATVGIRRQTLLLPPGFLDKLSADELDALLAHEFAHMARWDFRQEPAIRNCSPCPLPTIPCCGSPARAWPRRGSWCAMRWPPRRSGDGRVMQDRCCGWRRCCPIAERRGYFTPSGFSMPTFLRGELCNLTRRNLEIKGARRLAIAAACVLVAFATCASALALRMDVKAPSSDGPRSPASVHVKADDLTVVSKVQPVYPSQAKKDKITGTVMLAATIGKDGTVENLEVVSGRCRLCTRARSMRCASGAISPSC